MTILAARMRTMPSSSPLPFSPPLSSWFEQEFFTATAAQQAAWPALLRGENLLLAAPTGQGKTLAAFLPIFEKLLPNSKESGLRCLYISPLRALCNDVTERLRRHVTSLCHTFSDTSHLTVGLWTGDTPSRQRQILRKNSPSIAVT